MVCPQRLGFDGEKIGNQGLEIWRIPDVDGDEITNSRIACDNRSLLIKTKSFRRVV